MTQLGYSPVVHVPVPQRPHRYPAAWAGGAARRVRQALPHRYPKRVNHQLPQGPAPSCQASILVINSYQ
jgi:hypothetical protein